MSKFVILLKQRGEGCDYTIGCGYTYDYTIGCGYTYVFFDAKDMKDAVKKMTSRNEDDMDDGNIHYYGDRIAEAIILPADGMVDAMEAFNVQQKEREKREKALTDTAQQFEAKEAAIKREETDLAEYERLKKKYEKTDDKPTKKGRKFTSISKEDLEAKIEALSEDGEDHPFDICTIKDELYDDLKVKFDIENCDYDQNTNDLVGFHTLDNVNGALTGSAALRLSFWGFTACGDWEAPVFFLVYWDGKKLRAYVPTKGNSFNTDTMKAFGNDAEADAANLIKRGLAEKDELYDEGHCICEAGDAPELNWAEIEIDIKERFVN